MRALGSIPSHRARLRLRLRGLRPCIDAAQLENVQRLEHRGRCRGGRAPHSPFLTTGAHDQTPAPTREARGFSGRMKGLSRPM